MKTTYTRQDYKNLLERAKLAEANGDPEAKYVISWMENLLKPTQWETSLLRSNEAQMMGSQIHAQRPRDDS